MAITIKYKKKGKSVAARAASSKSAAAQSKQIQTLARSVQKLKDKNKRQSSTVMTIARNENVALHRANPQSIGGASALAQDLAWVMPIPYAPTWTENPAEVSSSISWANNSPIRTRLLGPPIANNIGNKRPVFGYTFLDKEVRGITHKGGTLSIRVTNTFKQATALHFFLVSPKKEFADSLLKDVQYLSDFTPLTDVGDGLQYRGVNMELREGVDYTYGAARTSIPNPSATPTPGYPEVPAKCVPDLAMMSTQNWDIHSYRRCFFDGGASQTLNTQPFTLNTSADPVNNLVYKNIRIKVPAAGFIRRSRTGGSNSGQLGTIDNMDIDDQENEKCVFLVCLRTLQAGGSTIPGGNTASNPNEYCSANITLLDKYKVAH